jgi:hypothetical protein
MTIHPSVHPLFSKLKHVQTNQMQSLQQIFLKGVECCIVAKMFLPPGFPVQTSTNRSSYVYDPMVDYCESLEHFGLVGHNM